MKPIHPYALVDLTIDISWKKDGILHKDRYFADELNCWRDILPGTPLEHLVKHCAGADLAFNLEPGELVSQYDVDKVFFLPWSRLNSKMPGSSLRTGRFYPQGMISGLPGIFKENVLPFRCVGMDANGITADLNHPMAMFPITLNLAVHRQSGKSEERGGICVDWLDLALSGPGMQTRNHQNPTDYFTGKAFDRRDPGPDTVFYETDRFVHHIDVCAREILSEVYRTLLRPGDRILDLMAGWKSHLPDDLEPASVHGIGLNENELKRNERLTGYRIQDLNANRRIESNDHAFDSVICSLSVEYLVDPVSLFKEVARVLKPGGIFAVTFSNRWFPEKAIRLWEELHDFERMGLVTEYFLKSGCFDSISTLSKRGYPRPYEDRYFPKLKLSDPIYVVTGKSVQ
jgi:SAM-dependent methyltransferase